MIANQLDKEMTKQGIIIHRNTNGVRQVQLDEYQKKIVTLQSTGDTINDVDVVIMAVGRVPNTEGLNLQAAGVATRNGYVTVDDYSNTSSPCIYALGDVCGMVELTPMAIAAGRRLGDRLFGRPRQRYDNAKVSYKNVPTVVFSHPPVGTIGLTEPQAVAKFGRDQLKVYTSEFSDSFYGVFEDGDAISTTRMKLVCAGVDEKVIGLHVVGTGADEMLQGFGVAIKMGATKADFDSCVAVHPTASEELVTMGTWGTSPAATGAKHSPLNGAPSAEPMLKSKL